MNKSAGVVGEHKKPSAHRSRLLTKASVGSLRQPNTKTNQNEKTVKSKLTIPTKASASKAVGAGPASRETADHHFISFDGHGSTMQPRILSKPASVARFETTLKEPLKPGFSTSRKSKQTGKFNLV